MQTTQDLIGDCFLGESMQVPIDANIMAKIERLQVAKLNPGDVLIVKCNGRLTQNTMLLLHESMGKLFPENEIMVIDKDVDVQVIANGE